MPLLTKINIKKVNKDKYPRNRFRSGSWCIYSIEYKWTLKETPITKKNMNRLNSSKIKFAVIWIQFEHNQYFWNTSAKSKKIKPDKHETKCQEITVKTNEKNNKPTVKNDTKRYEIRLWANKTINELINGASKAKRGNNVTMDKI